MRWLLIGYMYLFIHRPFEIWPTLGEFRIELIFALLAGCVWLMTPNKKWLANPLHWGLFGFAAAVLICWLLSPLAEQGANHVDKYFKQLFLFVLLTTLIHDEKSLKHVAQAFLIIMFIYMLHSLWEFRGGRHVRRMGIERLIGIDTTLGDPNAFSSTLLYALALLPAMWVGVPSRKWRWFLGAYAVLSLVCMALTGSRGTFVAFCIWAFLCIARSKYRTALIPLSIAAAPVMWMFLPESLQNRFETIINPSVGPRNAQVSAEGRLNGLLLGAKLWDENPLTGCGPGVWKKATGSKIEAHNLYGQVIGEMGTLGALAFASLVCFYAWNRWKIGKRYRQHPEWGRDFLWYFAESLGLALLLLLLVGNFAHNLYRYTWVWYSAFMIITRYCVEQRHLAETNRLPASLRPPPLLMPMPRRAARAGLAQR